MNISFSNEYFLCFYFICSTSDRNSFIQLTNAVAWNNHFMFTSIKIKFKRHRNNIPLPHFFFFFWYFFVKCLSYLITKFVLFALNALSTLINDFIQWNMQKNWNFCLKNGLFIYAHSIFKNNIFKLFLSFLIVQMKIKNVNLYQKQLSLRFLRA